MAVLALLTATACASGGGSGQTRVKPHPEDFEHDPANRRLIVASDPPAFVAINDDGTLGAVTQAVFDERPLDMVGISLTPDGRLLYAINKNTRRIDVFEVKPDALVYRESLPQHDSIRKYANEVFAVRENQVYVSNAQGSRHPLLEALFKRPQANLMYWNGAVWQEAATGIRFGNGMQISADEKTFYVAGFQDRAIHVYRREPDGLLTETALIDVGGGPDNLKWADDARTMLLVPTHRSSFNTFLHLRTCGRWAAPSEVRTVTVPPAPRDVKTIYPAAGQTGREVHAASTALLIGKDLYISQIVRPYLFHCRVP